MPRDEVQRCAALINQVIPMLMRTIGPEMRKRHEKQLSMPQFHALIYIKQNEGASLSLLSEHLGGTLSSASKLIDGMVERGLVTREDTPDDRRRMLLRITGDGDRILETVHQIAIDCTMDLLTPLSNAECAGIADSMGLLISRLFPQISAPCQGVCQRKK